MQIKRTLTCIVCPRGCMLDVTLTDGKVTAVSGNICKRGASYAIDECTAPKRTVTSTMRTEDGALVAVKTDKPVPKELVFEVMRAVNSTLVPATAKIGDTAIDSVAGTDAAVVVTSEKYS